MPPNLLRDNSEPWRHVFSALLQIQDEAAALVPAFAGTLPDHGELLAGKR